MTEQQPERLWQGRTRGRVIGAIALIAAFAIGFAVARTGTSDPDRTRVEHIVRDYILAHPEIIPEAAKRMHERDTAKLIAAHRAAIETPFHGAWAGAADGDAVLVEFFDYACGFCRASNPDVARLLKEDKKLKVVWRELPVLGEPSIAAARVSLAAAKQDRFRQFHDQLFAAGRPTQETVAAVQAKLGVATGAGSFDDEIDRNYELARVLGATGTPTFVVGDKVLQGAVGYEVLKAAIAEARKRAS